MIPSLKPIVWAGLVIVLLLALWVAYNALTAKPRAEARLGRNTTEAALESGRDAVATVGEQAASEDATDAITQENTDAIRNAQGSDAPVAAPVRDAGLAALCRRASYRNDPRCLR